MFSFGLANFVSLSDRMSDMLKKFSTSLKNYKEIASMETCDPQGKRQAEKQLEERHLGRATVLVGTKLSEELNYRMSPYFAHFKHEYAKFVTVSSSA